MATLAMKALSNVNSEGREQVMTTNHMILQAKQSKSASGTVTQKAYRLEIDRFDGSI